MKKQYSVGSFGVIGLGRFGTALVETLAAHGHEVIAVDKDEQRVKTIQKYTDFAFVREVSSAESLEETGIQNCKRVAICIGEHVDVSILTTMHVLKMGVPHVISKANSKEHGEVLRHLGATVVYPESDMAVYTAYRMISDNLLDYITLNNYVEVRRLQLEGQLTESTIQDIDIRRKYKINIIAIERNHHTIVDFSPQYQFQAGDIITVIGNVDDVNRFEQQLLSKK